MDRQSTFLMALGLLIAAAAFVSASGWILFVRDRRAGRGGTSIDEGAEAVDEHALDHPPGHLRDWPRD